MASARAETAGGVGARLLATASHPDVPPEQAGYASDDRYHRMAAQFEPLVEEPSSVLGALLAHTREALDEAGGTDVVHDGMDRLWREDPGADRQRAAWEAGGLTGVLDVATVAWAG